MRFKSIAGADVAYKGGEAVSAIVILSYPEFKLIDKAVLKLNTPFPYIPGYFFLRELKPIIAVYERLSKSPDCLLIDGHGFAHPTFKGLACRIGEELKIPTIGCAKSLLVGRYKGLKEERGSTSPIIFNNRTVGYAVRTRTDVKPVFVSVGYGISLKRACWVVLQCSKGYRIPEPLRYAHHLSKVG